MMASVLADIGSTEEANGLVLADVHVKNEACLGFMKRHGFRQGDVVDDHHAVIRDLG